MATTRAASTFSRRPARPSVTWALPTEYALRARSLHRAAKDRERDRRQQRVVQTGQRRHTELVQPRRVHLAEKERHDPVEQDARERPAGDEEHRQQRRRADDELPQHADRVAEQRERERRDPFRLVQQEVLGHPADEPRDRPRRRTLERAERDRQQVHQLGLRTEQRRVREHRRLQQERRDDDHGEQDRSAHGTSGYPVPLDSTTSTTCRLEKSTAGRTVMAFSSAPSSERTRDTVPIRMFGGYRLGPTPGMRNPAVTTFSTGMSSSRPSLEPWSISIVHSKFETL